MKKFLKIGLIMLMTCSLMGSSFLIDHSQAASDPLSDYKNEQKKLEADMKAQQKLINQAENKKKEYQNQLANLDVQVSRLEKDMQSADIQLQVCSNQITDTEKKLKETQADLDERVVLFNDRMKESYMTGDVTFYDVLFEASSFSDFLMRYDMLERLMEQDVQLLDEIEANKASIEEKQVSLEKKHDDLAQLKQNKQSSINNLEKLQKDKQALASAAETDKVTAAKAYAEMEELSEEIAVKIRKIQEANKNNITFSGVFAWPLPGYTSVSSDYGMRTHPVLNVKKMHTGVDLPAPKGTSIKAADDGVVISSGRLGAFGNAVIIDHGSGIATLYGHMSSITMRNGASIKRGDEVGKVGTTGSSTGNHLHFEVRKNGSPVSPWTYLK